MVINCLVLINLAAVHLIVTCHLLNGVKPQRSESTFLTKHRPNDLVWNFATMVEHGVTNNDVELYSSGKYHLNDNNPIYYNRRFRNRSPHKKAEAKPPTNFFNARSDMKRNGKRYFHRKRKGLTEERESSSFPQDVPWRNATQIWQRGKEVGQDLREKKIAPSDFCPDIVQYLSVLKNYYMVPKKTFDLLPSKSICANREVEFRRCETIFSKNPTVGRVWPRDLLNASCRCVGQRCTVLGMETCTTLVSRVTVIGYDGSRSRDVVPIACICMAHKGETTDILLPVLV